jgi:hypothetical protein
MLVPDLRLIVGGSLLVLFLAVNWLRVLRMVGQQVRSDFEIQTLAGADVGR